MRSSETGPLPPVPVECWRDLCSVPIAAWRLRLRLNGAVEELRFEGRRERGAWDGQQTGVVFPAAMQSSGAAIRLVCSPA